MNTLTADNSNTSTDSTPPAAAQAVMRLLNNISCGHLTVHLPNGTQRTFGPHAGEHATIVLHNWNVCSAALKSGDIGFAESFIAGDWSSPDLVALLNFFVANRKAMDDVIFGKWWGRLAYRVKHLLNRNTKANSRKNIHAHYDLGNAFYLLWLDETMNYSSALFEGNTQQSLPQAQHAKVRRALSMAGVQPGHRVLEIGCGWGALAEKGAAEFGAHMTGVTLSTEQLAYAQDRLARLGLSERADLRLQDYRDIADEPFDAICSIEMIEAVGQEYWPTYFETVNRLLKPGGRACIQAITIRNDLFARYLKSTDFIQQYIFPGGCLLSPETVEQQAAQAGLKVVDSLAFGKDYGLTCKLWRERFVAQREAVLALDFDERFMRIWEFYLAYCEAGFEAGDIDVVQFTLAK
jgi:cyclopropane-fatty-acyl-phospholipid synthase